MKSNIQNPTSKIIPSAPGGRNGDAQLQPATVAPGNLSKAPRLQKGNDTEVAAELGRLVRDAQDGTRRILLCGLFIETIVANLKRGELGPWIESHRTEIGVGQASIYGWRDFSREVLKQVGLENYNALEFSKPLHETLALPASEVPEDCREARAKIDELIEGKSVKQLMFQFREGEVFEDKLVRTGRGGDRTESRSGLRRTREQIDREAFEAKAFPACNNAALWIGRTLIIEGPNKERAFWVLDDKKLEDLKMAAHDLHRACLDYQHRRAAVRRTGK